MLPLDTLTPGAVDYLKKHGVSENDVLFAVHLDLDGHGSTGESFAVYDASHRRVCSFSPDADQYNQYELALISLPYIDHFASRTRLLLRINKEDGKEETLISAVCTNARKSKLVAFCELLTRIQAGYAVTADDPIFEQFNRCCPKCGTRYEDQNRRICKNCSRGGKIVTRLLSYFKYFKPQLAGVFCCMLLSSAIALVSPVIKGVILYDDVIATTGRWHTIEKVYIVVGVIFGMAILSSIVSILQSRAAIRMSNRVTRKMKLDVFSSMTKLSLSFFNKNSTGRLINRVDYDALRIHDFYTNGVPTLIVNAINFIGLSVFLFILNWRLTLIVFIPVPIIVVIFKKMLPKLWRMYTKQWHASSSMNSMLGDSLEGVRVVKAFAKEAEESHRFYGYAQKLYDSNLKLNLVSLTIFPFVGLLIGLSSQAIWGYGGLQVMGGEMTYGEFSTYLLYVGMIFGPLNFFSNFTNLLTETINAAERMFDIMDTIPEISDAPDAADPKYIRGDIDFDNVCFHYAPNRPIIKDMTMHIKAGDHIGVVGHTGSGKSTMANLITRMYDTVSGSVKIDGINVRDLKCDCIRRNVAIVSQEVYIFYGTIADNIRYARPDATDEDVINAARAANAHDFIINLPAGYETLVGGGSRSLSGGERQRISIARALLLAPSILILDEATAAMDTQTEQRISEALEKVSRGRTTVTIAHRLSTLRDCNYLYAIENGEIAEGGTHEELIAKKGVYWKLYTLQSEAMEKVVTG